MTIYQIRERTRVTAPYFFTPETMRFFGQTMNSFSIKALPDGKFRISAPMIDKSRNVRMGTTVRIFNPETNELEMEESES